MLTAETFSLIIGSIAVGAGFGTVGILFYFAFEIMLFKTNKKHKVRDTILYFAGAIILGFALYVYVQVYETSILGYLIGGILTGIYAFSNEIIEWYSQRKSSHDAT